MKDRGEAKIDREKENAHRIQRAQTRPCRGGRCELSGFRPRRVLDCFGRTGEKKNAEKRNSKIKNSAVDQTPKRTWNRKVGSSAAREGKYATTRKKTTKKGGREKEEKWFPPNPEGGTRQEQGTSSS